VGSIYGSHCLRFAKEKADKGRSAKVTEGFFPWQEIPCRA
jgi:hypothetical protein